MKARLVSFTRSCSLKGSCILGMNIRVKCVGSAPKKYDRVKKIFVFLDYHTLDSYGVTVWFKLWGCGCLPWVKKHPNPYYFTPTH